MSDRADIAIEIRPMEPTDRAFVASTWTRSHADMSGVPRVIHSKYQPRLIDHLLDRVTTVIACSPETPSAIHGWVCASPPVLHFAYTPYELRGNGIARMLVRHVLGGYPDRIEVTHRCMGHTGRYVWNPYWLLFVGSD